VKDEEVWGETHANHTRKVTHLNSVVMPDESSDEDEGEDEDELEEEEQE
jgi:hypothetical protein